MTNKDKPCNSSLCHLGMPFFFKYFTFPLFCFLRNFVPRGEVGVSFNAGSYFNGCRWRWCEWRLKSSCVSTRLCQHYLICMPRSFVITLSKKRYFLIFHTPIHPWPWKGTLFACSTAEQVLSLFLLLIFSFFHIWDFGRIIKLWLFFSDFVS